MTTNVVIVDGFSVLAVIVRIPPAKLHLSESPDADLDVKTITLFPVTTPVSRVIAYDVVPDVYTADWLQLKY